jgi:alpha-beta hydrolase superfamily lysophospholipase
VLYIDYDGTGDSAGSEADPGRVEAWQRTVRSAVDLVRSGGARHVSVVGMRLGATLAASVAHECALDALVLWDPCDSGRSWLREEALLRAVYLEDQGLVAPPPATPVGCAAVETLGTVYVAETVRAMSKLAIESTQGPLARRVLVLFRPERAPRRAVAERLAMPHVELAQAVGQEELLSVWPLRALVPKLTLTTIVEWLSRIAGPETSPVVVAGPQASVISDPQGDEVLEEVRHVGPNRLFGILTQPSNAAPSVTAVLLNSGLIDHLGPGRLWVSLARSWAQAGLAVLRVDLGGLGDSPVRPGQEPDCVFPPHALDDISDIVRDISPSDASAVVLAGLCSGAYHSIAAGIAMGTRGVLAINPLFFLAPDIRESSLAGRPVLRPTTGVASPALRARLAAGRVFRTLVRRLDSRTRQLVELMGPGALPVLAIRRLARSELRWWVVNRAASKTRPVLAFKRLVDRGVDTFVVCGSSEGTMITRGERAMVRRLHEDQRFRMEVLPEIDHSLFTKAARDHVLPLMKEHVTRRYAGASDVGQPGMPLMGPVV